IYVAQEVQHAGYKRVIDAIDANILNDTVEKVKAAAEGDKLLSQTQKASTSSITITSMPHPSDNDPNPHSSVLFQSAEGWEVCKGHVVPDQKNQEV
ncbi:hypothetical protein K469DRAFT_458029, partial [Zopfia rhizophila CBS 207.26]